VIGNNDGGMSIGEHEVETVGRVGGVEREVGSTCLEYGEESHHHVCSPRQAHPHYFPFLSFLIRRSGANAQAAEVVSEVVSLGIELVVSD